MERFVHIKLLADVFPRNETAATGFRSIHHNDCVRKRSTVDDNGAITRRRNACHQAKDQVRVRLMDLGLDQLDPLRPRVTIAPNEGLRHAASAQRDLIFCTRSTGPSRYERRRAYKKSLHPEIPSAVPRHLGTFDGERKRLAAAPDPGETLARDLASFVWLCAFLLILAFVAGAL